MILFLFDLRRAIVNKGTCASQLNTSQKMNVGLTVINKTVGVHHKVYGVHSHSKQFKISVNQSFKTVQLRQNISITKYRYLLLTRLYALNVGVHSHNQLFFYHCLLSESTIQQLSSEFVYVQYLGSRPISDLLSEVVMEKCGRWQRF